MSDLLTKTVELTARKKGSAEKILHLTSQQAGLLEPEQVHRLLDLVAQKQKLIDDIKIIDSKLRQIEDEILNMSGVLSWFELKAVFKEEDLNIIDDLRRDILVLLKEAQKLDGLNRQTLSKKCGELKKVMQDLRTRKRASKAYQGNAVRPGAYFIDHKK